MAIYKVQLFRVVVVDGVNKTVEEPGFAVEAFTTANARVQTVAKLIEMGKELRSISHTLHNGLVAVTTGGFQAEPGAALPPPPPPAPLPVDGWGGGRFGGGGVGAPPL